MFKTQVDPREFPQRIGRVFKKDKITVCGNICPKSKDFTSSNQCKAQCSLMYDIMKTNYKSLKKLKKS